MVENSNCCKCTDPQYTIVLNEQGPQGIQGVEGEDGFSPQISLYNVTDTNVQLKILNKEDTVITPNLKAQNDIMFAPWTGQANSTDGTITLQGNFSTPSEVNEDVTTYQVNYGINQIGYVNVTRDGPSLSIVSNATQTYTTLIYQNGVLIDTNEAYSLNNQNVLANNPLSLTKDNKTHSVTWNLNYDNSKLALNDSNQLTINEEFTNNLVTTDTTQTISGQKNFNDVYINRIHNLNNPNASINMAAGTMTMGFSTISEVNLANGNVTLPEDGVIKTNNIQTLDNKEVFKDNPEEARFEIGSTTEYLVFKAMTNSNLVVYRGSTDNVPHQIIDTYNMMTYLPKATTTSLGMVKPDGTTITITEDGVITAVGGGGGSLPDNVITSDNISQNEYIQQLEQRIAALEALIDGGNSSND